MPSHNVTKKRGKSKVKISDKRAAVMNKLVDSYSDDFDVKMAVIQELIPLGLKALAKEQQYLIPEISNVSPDNGLR